MTSYEIYTLVLSLIVCLLFTVLFTVMIAYMARSSVKLIRLGDADGIESAKHDGCRGYSIRSIYGCGSGFWKEALKEIHPMKKAA